MTLFFGAIFIAVGIWFLVRGRGDWKRRRRILDTPTSPIASAPKSGRVEITGRIVAGPEGLVRSPLRDLEAVWCRVIVEEYRGNGSSESQHTISDDTDSRPFFVDDGSPLPALVRPAGARSVLDSQKVYERGTLNDASGELEQYLAARYSKSTGLPELNRLRVREEVMLLGDTVYAMGMAEYEGPPMVESGYRTATSRRLVLSAGLEDELVLSNKSERDLVSSLSEYHYTGLAVIATGVLVAAAGQLFGRFGNSFGSSFGEVGLG